MEGIASLDQFMTAEVLSLILNSTNALGISLMENILLQGCTTHILDTIFTRTEPKALIQAVVKAIQRLTAIRKTFTLHRIVDRFTSQQIMKILGYSLKYTSSLNLGVPMAIYTSLLHYVVHRGQITIVKELFLQLNENQCLELLSTTDNQYNMNAFGWAIMAGNIEAIEYIREFIGPEKTYRLAEVKGNSGCTALHLASLCHTQLDEIFKSLSLENISRLLSIQDVEGQSVLALSISDEDKEAFCSILKHFTNNPVDLIELARVQTNDTGSSFSLAAMNQDIDYLLSLTRVCYSVTSVYEFKLAIQEVLDGYEAEMPVPEENLHLLRWLLEQSTRSYYPLVGQPSVLVISMVRHREGAKHEADSILAAFKTIGFQVTYKTNLNEDEIHREIRKAQDSRYGKNGQIVVVMGHGSQGHICDVDLKEIPIGQLERSMAPQSLAGTPKILIVQACQHVPQTYPGSLERASSDMELLLGGESMYDPIPSGLVIYRPYTPVMKDFFTMISSVTGGQSERHVFIPLISEAIVKSFPNDDIHKVFTDAHSMMSKIRTQIPVVGSTMRGLLCLKNVYQMAE